MSCVLECNCNSNWFKSFPPNNHGPTNRYLQHLLGLLISETLKTKRYCAPGNKAFSGNLSRVKGARGPLKEGTPCWELKYIYIYIPPLKLTFENDVPFLEVGYRGTLDMLVPWIVLIVVGYIRITMVMQECYHHFAIISMTARLYLPGSWNPGSKVVVTKKPSNWEQFQAEHPWRLTWNRKIMVWEMIFLFQWCTCNLRGVSCT